MDQSEVPGAETNVDGRTVRQPRRQQRFEEETEVHGAVAHALGADGQPPGLADHQVSPLHHHDRNEEGRLGVRERLGLHHAARDVLALLVIVVPVAFSAERVSR